MIGRIREILKKSGIDQWTLMETESSAGEYFFIHRDMDMFRKKKVTKYSLTVFNDHEGQEKKYRGSATITLDSGMEAEELRKKIEDAYFAASFVKNPWYPLSPAVKGSFAPGRTRLNEEDRTPLVKDITESLFRPDSHDKGGINSFEIFLNRQAIRFLSSEGSDCSFEKTSGDIELICDWKENDMSVELYNMFSFADFSASLIEDECRRQIENCRLRASASPAQKIENIPVILGEEAVREMIGFYRTHSNVKALYEGTARGKKGEIFQGSDIRGDLIDMTLVPTLPGSPESAPIDRDGMLLKEVRIFEKGRLVNLHGPVQYASYMDEEPRGSYGNTVVACGSGSVEEWRVKPHIEILAFSDFQMDAVTGDFGGEVRLAKYYDGKEVRALTGASLSACLFDVHKEIYLSREKLEKENYSGPRYIMFPGATLAGA